MLHDPVGQNALVQPRCTEHKILHSQLPRKQARVRQRRHSPIAFVYHGRILALLNLAPHLPQHLQPDLQGHLLPIFVVV